MGNKEIENYSSVKSNSRFDVTKFRELASSNTIQKLKTYASVEKRLVRSIAPMRGFGIKWSNNVDAAMKFYWSVFDLLIEHINSSNLTAEQKESIIRFEKYQSQQKGPTAPVTKEHILKAFEGINQTVAINIDQQDIRLLKQSAANLSDYLNHFCKYSVKNVNFEEAWKALPSTTVRGFPYNGLGRDVDQNIMQDAGNTLESVLSFTKSMSQDVAFLGWRIQGKPVAEGPKLRPVFIPSIYSQYILTGLVHYSMSLLKHAPLFAGWQDPITRHSTILKMLTEAQSSGFKIIQLDYSKFDQRFAPIFREMALDISLAHLREKDIAERIKEAVWPYYAEQFALFPAVEGIKADIEQAALIDLVNQLLSGRKVTQEDGSKVNAILQGYLAAQLGYDLNYNWCLVLGDDAGFPVPISLLKSEGYVKVLERIEELLAPTGFIMNAKKAYPTDELIFLQKLYNLDINIEGVGSWARSLFSFIFRENFPKHIEGISSIAIMEIISQLSIMNEAFARSGASVNDFGKKFAQIWINEDDGLRFLLQKFSEKSNSPHEFFKYLIKISRVGVDEILDFTDRLSYDHSDLRTQLHANNYGEVFYMLPYLLEADYSREVRSDVQDLFGDLEDYAIDAEDLEDLED